MRDLAALRDAIGSGLSPAVLGWRMGLDRASDALLARSAVLEQPLAAHWAQDVASGAQAVFPVTAADLMPALQGPALGAKLTALQEIWLTSGLTMTREQLLA